MGRKKAATLTAPEPELEAELPSAPPVDLWFTGEYGALKVNDRPLRSGEKFSAPAVEAVDLLKRSDVTSTEPLKPKGEE